MSKKEAFKEFVKTRPELTTYVKNNSMSWQKFYELYDMYGADENVWKDYPKTDNNTSVSDDSRISLNELVKKVNVASVQKHIGTAQKAINLFKEFGIKGTSNATNTLTSLGKGPLKPRPLNKFFED